MNTHPLLASVRAFLGTTIIQQDQQNISENVSDFFSFVREAVGESCSIFDLKLKTIDGIPSWRFLPGSTIIRAARAPSPSSVSEFEWMEYPTGQINERIGFLAIRSLYNPETVCLHIFESSKSKIRHGVSWLQPVKSADTFSHIVSSRRIRGIEQDYDHISDIVGLTSKREAGDFTNNELSNHVLDWILINYFKPFAQVEPRISGNSSIDCHSSMICITNAAATAYASRKKTTPDITR